MAGSDLPRDADFDCLWAKSSDAGGLPLARHLLDVAAVCSEIVARLPEKARYALCESLSLAPESGMKWIAALVGLHDLGKACPGFQSKWEAGRERVTAAGFRFPVGAPDRHDAATLALLPGLLRRRNPQVDRATVMLLSDAVAAHHGYRVPHSEALSFSSVDAPAPAEWSRAHEYLVDLVLEVLQPAGIPNVAPAQRPLVWQELAGLCSFCDWVGSSEAFFPHDRPREGMRVWFERSRELARSALARIGWTDPSVSSFAPPSDQSPLSLALPPGTVPRPLQSAVVDLSAGADGPALVLIEAPMGEGKTEAAFAAYAALAGPADHRGVYVAMPTQATSNAIFGRVAIFLGRMSRRPRETLQLVHGGARLEDTELRLREIGFGPEDSSVNASAWFAGSRKGLLAPNAVGTIDQALVAVLNARHAFVRMFGLAGRFVILDEVHAYDDYTGGLLERLVGWLSRLGCSVVVMSATLPAAKRQALVRAWRADATLPELDYPRACVVRRAGVKGQSFAAARNQRVQIMSAPDEVDLIARQAARSVADGGCALVVANSVRRAQQIYEALRPHTGIERLLFHARYPFEDRLARERAVVDRFGPDGIGRDRVVVVATQVVEQSLDVDFDVLFSDLAPIDLLLQRVGRLHRHTRTHPAPHEVPVLYVVGLGAEGVPPLDPRRVYDDWPVLRTAAILRGRRWLELPADIDRLVQQVYGSDPLGSEDADLAGALRDAGKAHAQMKARQAELASQAALPMPDEWVGWTAARPVDDADAELAGQAGGTRLGEPSTQVVPIFDLGERWSVDAAGESSWSKRDPIPAEVRRRLAMRHLRLARHVATDVSSEQGAPRGWSASPLTAPFVPLVLDAEGVALGQRVRLRLDQDLGLTVERLPR
jgi:CRISPR-associated endonuclease/helicase Cas3